MLDLDLQLGEANFSSRAAVLLLQDGLLLLNRFDDATFWFTPGGRIRVDEASEEAARREFLEETGVPLGTLRLALVAEVFGQHAGRARYGLKFFYVARDLPALPRGRFPNRSDAGVTFDWFPLADLDQLDVRPPFLTAMLPMLFSSSEIHHAVHRI